MPHAASAHMDARSILLKFDMYADLQYDYCMETKMATGLSLDCL